MRKYTKDHEWVELEDSIATIGITQYNSDFLGYVTNIDFPMINSEFLEGEVVVLLESDKRMVEVFVPVSGKVIECNELLLHEPSLINEDPEGKSWLFKVEVCNNFDKEMNDLLDSPYL